VCIDDWLIAGDEDTDTLDDAVIFVVTVVVTRFVTVNTAVRNDDNVTASERVTLGDPLSKNEDTAEIVYNTVGWELLVTKLLCVNAKFEGDTVYVHCVEVDGDRTEVILNLVVILASRETVGKGVGDVEKVTNEVSVGYCVWEVDDVADIDDIAEEVLVTPNKVAVISGVIVLIAGVIVKSGLEVCEFFDEIVSNPFVGVNRFEFVPLCEFIKVRLDCTDSLGENEFNAVLADVRLIRALEDIEKNELDVKKLEREGKIWLPEPFVDLDTLGEFDDDDDKLDDDVELIEDLTLCEINELILIRGVLLNNEVAEVERLTLIVEECELLKTALPLIVFCIDIEDDSDGDASLLADTVPPLTSVNVAIKDAGAVRENVDFDVTVGTNVETAEVVTQDETLIWDVDVTVNSGVTDVSKEALGLKVIKTVIVPTKVREGWGVDETHWLLRGEIDCNTEFDVVAENVAGALSVAWNDKV
jgi:hypothetical protein